MKIAGTIAIVAAIYLLRLDPYAGLILDDAWYMVLGKSLALGEGFRLISSSAAPILPAVPPGFPAILSIVFWFSPSYPDNIYLLKVVSLLAMAGVGVACWWDFTRHRDVPRDQAVLLATAVMLTPAFVFLATSAVMAEAVFTMLQLLTVIAVERAVRRDAEDTRGPLLSGALASAATLVRTAGIAAIGASLVYLLVQRRWRQAGIFAATVATILLPWQLYARANAPGSEDRLANGGTIAYSYEQLLAMERPGAVGTDISRDRFLARYGRNLQDMLTRDVGALVLPSLYRGPAESGEEAVSVGRPGRGSMGGAVGTMVVSAVIVCVMLAGVSRRSAWLSLPVLLIAASMAMIASVGSLTFRYVLPLSPFLLLYLWRGIWHPASARIALMVVLGFQLMDHSLFIREKRAGTAVWGAEAADAEALLTWMGTHLDGPGAIASSNPGLVYLRTGRKGVVSSFPDANWERWRASGVRYVAALRKGERPPRRPGAQLLFQTNGRLWIVEM